jgi:hypothetical protein
MSQLYVFAGAIGLGTLIIYILRQKMAAGFRAIMLWIIAALLMAMATWTIVRAMDLNAQISLPGLMLFCGLVGLLIGGIYYFHRPAKSVQQSTEKFPWGLMLVGMAIAIPIIGISLWLIVSWLKSNF